MANAEGGQEKASYVLYRVGVKEAWRREVVLRRKQPQRMFEKSGGFLGDRIQETENAKNRVEMDVNRVTARAEPNGVGRHGAGKIKVLRRWRTCRLMYRRESVGVRAKLPEGRNAMAKKL